MEGKYLRYQRSRFSTRLFADRLYTPGHSWLCRQKDGRWRIGFTKFATRMLGEPVELDFEVERGAQIDMGTIVGWVEGFKAVTDVYCPMTGRFEGANPALEEHIQWIQSDPYGRGWLYIMEGTPGRNCVDVDGYVSILDGTIDKMLGKTP